MIIEATTRAAPEARFGRAAPHERRHEPARLVCLILLGMGAGISPFWGAYYATGIWVPIGVALVVVAGALAVARPPRLSPPSALVLLGLIGLALWGLLSGTWAHAADPATSVGNLLVLYAAFLIAAMVLVEEPRHAAVLLGAAGVGVLIVGLSVVVRMFGADASSLFLFRRLNSPLGYINGEGCVFAMCIWLGVAVAERREPVVAGAGAATAVVFACLTVLSQSRGAAIATIAAIVVTLAVAPGFRRRTLAMVFVGLGVTAVGSRLLDVYTKGHAISPTAGTVHSAALATVIAAVVVGLVWGLLVAVGNVLGGRDEAAGRVRFAATAVVVLVLVAIPVAGLARLGPIERTLSHQWHAFTHLSNPPGASGLATQTRLFSGGGNRYDYWRIAWDVWRKHPLGGVGAGNYTESYVLARRTGEYVQNPHSIELQVVSELGLVGGLLLLLAVAGVMLGVWRMRVPALQSRLGRMLMVGATGAAVVWFTDTSGDWMHLLPGVTALALIAITVIVRTAAGPPSHFRPELPSGRRLGLGTGVALGVTLAIAGASLVRQGAVHVFVDRAHADIASNPRGAVSEANRALSLDASDLDAYYAKAAALARLHRAAAAQNALLHAARADPTDFVTWSLLGDLAVRARDYGLARLSYGRAHALNPRDPDLARAAVQPTEVLG